MKKKLLSLFAIALISFQTKGQNIDQNAEQYNRNEKYAIVETMALEILKTGFNAGDGYNEVWVRDLNTFIKFSCRILEKDVVRDALLKFFYFQGFDGNMVDGYQEVKPGHKADNYGVFSRYDMPGYVFHKNSVETDQETSLVQAVYKYIEETGDKSILAEEVNGMTVHDRLEKMLSFLMKHRFNSEYGLIWGATTADWGDVQPRHRWGVKLDDQSAAAIDIYDNAMFLIAIDNFLGMNSDPAMRNEWKATHKKVSNNVRQHLWDQDRQKFRPHIYIRCKEFEDINEEDIFYHGGTIIAIQAGLLSKEELIVSLKKMRENVKAANAQSIGLTLYPVYPDGAFENKNMGAYSYQNGGDWTWFGARLIPELVKYGLVEDAIKELDPFIDRVIGNDGFYEWYTVDGQPRGSGVFRGSAGVLLEAMDALLTHTSK